MSETEKLSKNINTGMRNCGGCFIIIVVIIGVLIIKAVIEDEKLKNQRAEQEITQQYEQ